MEFMPIWKAVHRTEEEETVRVRPVMGTRVSGRAESAVGAPVIGLSGCSQQGSRGPEGGDS